MTDPRRLMDKGLPHNFFAFTAPGTGGIAWDNMSICQTCFRLHGEWTLRGLRKAGCSTSFGCIRVPGLMAGGVGFYFRNTRPKCSRPRTWTTSSELSDGGVGLTCKTNIIWPKVRA